MVHRCCKYQSHHIHYLISFDNENTLLRNSQNHSYNTRWSLHLYHHSLEHVSSSNHKSLHQLHCHLSQHSQSAQSQYKIPIGCIRAYVASVTCDKTCFVLFRLLTTYRNPTKINVCSVSFFVFWENERSKLGYVVTC